LNWNERPVVVPFDGLMDLLPANAKIHLRPNETAFDEKKVNEPGFCSAERVEYMKNSPVHLPANAKRQRAR